MKNQWPSYIKYLQNKEDDKLKIKNIETDSQICNQYDYIKKLRCEIHQNIKKQSIGLSLIIKTRT